MDSDQLQFIGGDPGAVKHGNFMNYYQFHSAKQRVDSFNPMMFPKANTNPILCLDIGCNTGELTKETLMYLKNHYSDKDCYFLAIDIDPTLINRAKEAIQVPEITFEAMDIMKQDNQKAIRECLQAYGKAKFDITFCFSVTMWIHINNGDEGLTEFLQFIKDISNTIIIEPQPWQCYRNAQRRLKKSGSDFPLYPSLKITSDVEVHIEKVLSTGSHHLKVFESLPSFWYRRIQSYQLLRLVHLGIDPYAIIGNLVLTKNK